MRKKILIVYGSIGLGHKVVAENIAAELANLGQIELAMLDLLDMYKGPLVSNFSVFYKWMVDQAPWLWGFFYTNKFFESLTLPLRLPFAGLKIQKFREFVNREKPDLILTCHPTGTGLVAYLKKHGEFNGPLVTTFSDYHFQPYWVYPFVDRYLVVTVEQKQAVAARGFEWANIVVTGLPVNPVFKKNFVGKAVAGKLGLTLRQPVILVMGGSRGWGVKISDIQALLASRHDFQIVVVTGDNPVLTRQIQEISQRATKVVKVFSSWSPDEIAGLYSISRILVTKPGGLSIAQALLKNLPMVLVNPLPTMEEMNLDYLLSHGAAVYAKNSQTLKTLVDRLLEDKKLYERLKTQMKILAAPQAARLAAESIIDILERGY